MWSKQEQVQLSGFGEKYLSPECVLTVAGLIFVSAARIGVQQVVSSFWGNFLFSNDIGALNKPLSQARGLDRKEKCKMAVVNQMERVLFYYI